MFETFQNLIRLIRYRTYYIDEIVFRLHWMYTTLLLLFFFSIITTKQLGGEPIDCDHNMNSVKSSVINNFCYIKTTYTIKTAFDRKVGLEIPQPGVNANADESDINHHIYYQWVWFILFFQAFCFYIPRWLWKGWESGKMKYLVSDYNEFISDENCKNKKSLIVNYIVNNRDHNETYARNYLLCLLLAFSNVLGQMFFINSLLNGEFLTYGFDIIEFMYTDPQLRKDPMVKVCVFQFSISCSKFLIPIKKF